MDEAGARGFRFAPAWVLDLMTPRPLDPDKNRVILFTAFMMLGLPTAVGFGLYNLFRTRQPYLAAAIFVFGGALFFTWTKVRNGEVGLPLYRATGVLFIALLLYMLLTGGPGGSRALWIYTFPMTTLILYGYRESMVWSVCLLTGVAAVFWIAPGHLKVYPFEPSFKVRFLVVYLLVWVIASWFDYLRQQYSLSLEAEHQRLQGERAALQEALSKVKQLSGMLPICSCCKKVRDDQGYWRQIEAYIRDRSEAEFSHGICPDCGEKLYPGVSRRGREA